MRSSLELIHTRGTRIMRLLVAVSRRLLLLAALAALTCSTPVRAQAVGEPATKTALASIFSDHMVLQRDMEIPIWGTADPGAEVTVTLRDESAEATADDDGKWRANLPSMEAGGPHELTVKVGDETTTLSDVLIGDVWVASGQSNMEWSVTNSDNAEKEIADADYPEIRFVDVPNVVSDKPLDSFESHGWQAVTPRNIGNFSAVAYFFARNLQKELDVPIGLIGCNWGGTRMEAWTSREALLSSETFAPIVKADEAEPENEEAAKWRKERAHDRPAYLFNGMTSAIIPYGIRGVIWYQGESNAGKANEYAELSKLMIADWRSRWDEGDFPFLLVQLAAWEPGGDSWPYLREAQTDTLEAPNVGMAVAIDIGHRTDIHPRNKQEVGRRLALAAQAIAYGDDDVVYSGPMFSEIAIEDGKAKLTFEHVGGGLKSGAEGGALDGFEIAGEDGKFVPAHAEIDGEVVVVSSDDVKEPTQVRYNWAAFPGGNLFNAEGLPAVPFRSQR
jgi:sialate O-acetylesterase